MRRAVALALLLAAALGPTAGAEQPCWKALVNDWYDGRIDAAYSSACYRAALESLPADGSYGLGGREELERGLRLALSREQVAAEAPGPSPPPLGPTLGMVGAIVALAGASAWAIDRRLASSAARRRPRRPARARRA